MWYNTRQNLKILGMNSESTGVNDRCHVTKLLININNDEK